jgi:hypothetical protein
MQLLLGILIDKQNRKNFFSTLDAKIYIRFNSQATKSFLILHYQSFLYQQIRTYLKRNMNTYSLLNGSSGIGKSTFIFYLLLRWMKCNDLENPDNFKITTFIISYYEKNSQPPLFKEAIIAHRDNDGLFFLIKKIPNSTISLNPIFFPSSNLRSMIKNFTIIFKSF